ncbi:MAG TPA: PEGA domain-containing protein [Thermoanaerobaculia bacterium]|nr:PEGA domain-containing protein [Thermoanaerobaculia bacterium]
MIDRTDIHRRRARVVRAACLALPFAALLALLVAPPVEAQASRTRPSGGTSGTAGGTGSRATATATPAPPAPAAASSRADATRPTAGQGGRTVVERDERSRPGSPGRDVVFVNPWGWWHSYAWRYGWGPWGWSGYGPHGGYYGPYGPAWAPRRVHDRMGALDLDLKPGDTEIWLDGQLIGIADRFDGWPGYLWLEEGDYHFVFYREGYRTIAREYRIYRGLVIDVVDRLERGESVPPEELVPPQPTPRRDARIRRNEELRRATAGTEGGESGGGGDWHERAPRGSSGEDDVGVGTLRLVVRPLDASVYLDGRFLGTGDEVARLRRGLAVSAGEHLLEVVRPGHAPLARRVVLDDGEDLELEVELEPRP